MTPASDFPVATEPSPATPAAASTAPTGPPSGVVPPPAATASTGVRRDQDHLPATEQFESVEASVVPVPMETFNRLVIAVDQLGSEMTNVQHAIRELTTTISDSQRSISRILTQQAPPRGGAAAVNGRSDGDAPATTNGGLPPVVERNHMTTGPVGRTVSPGDAADGGVASLDDVPLVSIGAVQVLLGPVTTLDQLDDVIARIDALGGVDSVAVTAFEGTEVLLTVQLSRALPLASVLRTELGRDVTSCRLVDGRIVVDFAEVAPTA